MTMQSNETLVLSAALTRQWVQQFCGACAPYHRIWQYLRLLNLATSPLDHKASYFDAFRPLIRAGMRRVLVSGCSDYAMPETVWQAYAAEGGMPDLTVVDMCETPLQLCRWHASRDGVSLATARSDIFAYEATAPFDIICSHILFAQIEPSLRPGLVARWRSLLVPRGRAITVNRIRPDAPDRIRYDADDAKRFGERVARAAEESGLKLDVSPAELAEMAEALFATPSPLALRSTAELERLFLDAGFRVETSVVEGSNATGGARVMRGGNSGFYVKLVATRD